MAISDSDMEKALDYLRESAEDAAQATADRYHLENTKSVIKAIVMSEHLAEPVNAQERYAYADMRYRNHLEGLKQAIFNEERLTNMRVAAEARIRAWQTQSSNQRSGL